MFSQATFAALCLASVTSAHMMMSNPVPYGKSTLNNSPLNADGSDFPCKQRTGVYDAEGANNVMALGSSHPLTFVGGATHGGGSCQISITYDENPTASSTFKVIHSIEGGCPVKNNNGNIGDSASSPDPDTYSFPIPSNLPTGNATLAWTWFNKIGNREMYMNCAPVTLTGGSSSKRSEDYEEISKRDQAAYNALPDMFVANIGNGCETQDSTDLLFPQPGDSVEQDGLQTSTALASPTGKCQAASAGASPTAGGSAAPTSATAASAAATTPAATPAPAASSPSAAGAPGGIFATVPSSAAAAPATASAAAAAAPTASAAPVPAPAPAASAASAPAAAPSSGSGANSSSAAGAMAAGSACSPEGTWNCIGGTSYQRCASGVWSVVQEMAAGTTCSAGQGGNIDFAAGSEKYKRRPIRFSQAHVRRHAQSSW